MSKYKAKDDFFSFGSSTAGANQMKAGFDLTDGVGYFEQDLSHFLKQAENDRHFQEQLGHRRDGMRKFATIPDAVALKIKEDHDLDLHDPMFNDNPNNMKRLKQIMLSEYKYLVVNN